MPNNRETGRGMHFYANIDALNLSSALSKSPWFSSMTPDKLNELASLATRVRLGADAVVFREGDPGDALHVVVTGMPKSQMYCCSSQSASEFLLASGTGIRADRSHSYGSQA